MIIPWRRETNDNVDHMWDHRETREADTGELIEGQHLLTEVQVGDSRHHPPASILLTSADNILQISHLITGHHRPLC